MIDDNVIADWAARLQMEMFSSDKEKIADALEKLWKVALAAKDVLSYDYIDGGGKKDHAQPLEDALIAVGMCPECDGTGRIENNRGRYMGPNQAFIVDRASGTLLGYECPRCKNKK